MAAAANPIQVPSSLDDPHLSTLEIQFLQAKLNRLIRNNLIRGFPIVESGRMDEPTITAVQSFCQGFAIDASVRFGPGSHLSKPQREVVRPVSAEWSRTNGALQVKFPVAAKKKAAFDVLPHLRRGSVTMEVLQWAVDHSEGPMSQMSPQGHVELAETMFIDDPRFHQEKLRARDRAIDGRIHKSVPAIASALITVKERFGYDLDSTGFLILALATIAAENGTFEPLDEGANYKGPSNNSAYEDFDVYEPYNARKASEVERVAKAKAKSEKEHPGREPVRLPGDAIGGNTGAGDGARYKGRGWVQLTHRDGYHVADKDLKLQSEANPEQASDPDNISLILAWYIATRGPVTGGAGTRPAAAHFRKVCDDLAHNRVRDLRIIVNGGLNGLANFERAFWAGRQFFRASHFLRVTRMGLKTWE